MLINPFLIGEYSAQGIQVPDHGESIIEPGNCTGRPMTAAALIQGCVYNSFEGEAVLREARYSEVSGNLGHVPLKKRQQSNHADRGIREQDMPVRRPYDPSPIVCGACPPPGCPHQDCWLPSHCLIPIAKPV